MNKPLWITVETTDKFIKSEVLLKTCAFLLQQNINITSRALFFDLEHSRWQSDLNIRDDRQKLLLDRVLQADILYSVDDAFMNGDSIMTSHGPDSYYLSKDKQTITQAMFDKLDEIYPFPILPDITIFVDVPPAKTFPINTGADATVLARRQALVDQAEQFRQNFFKKIDDDLDKCDRDGTQSRYHIVNGYQSIPLIINDCNLILSPYFNIDL